MTAHSAAGISRRAAYQGAMKSITCLALLTVALVAAPVRATTGLETVSGTIRVGALSPQPARMAYNASPANNGVVGYVWALPANADGKTYTLKRTSGVTGTEDLDAYFFTDLASDQGSCDASADLKETKDTETGTVCPSPTQTARYVIIVVKTGLNTNFTFTIA